MSHQQYSQILPDVAVEQEPSSTFLTHCYRNALDRLNRSFTEKRPLAILIGEGKSASGCVVRTFLSSLDEDVAVARITEPCADAVDLMRKIIRAAGFQPKDLHLADLESIFRMFLAFQKGHGRRTIVCLEEVQDSEWWVLDKIRSLVELEGEGKYGLMLIISGQPGLKELLDTRPLNFVSTLAGRRISLAPFSPAETREYIRRRVEAAGTLIIDEVFEYHAIPLIHELCSGVPDAVGTLTTQCLELADEEGVDLVTIELVKRAYEIRRATTEPRENGADSSTVSVDEIMPARRLIVRLTDEDVQEKTLSQGHILIGRSSLCDIRIDSPIVSRQHALITYLPDGATLVDLSSTNGTFVDGHRIQQHELVAGESIAIGDCRIEYVIDDAEPAQFQETEQFEGIESLPTRH